MLGDSINVAGGRHRSGPTSTQYALRAPLSAHPPDRYMGRNVPTTGMINHGVGAPIRREARCGPLRLAARRELAESP